MPSLEVRDLTVRFGGLVALDRVSIDVPEGQIIGLIGPNGAGKTTLLNCISRFCDPVAGSIRFDGRDLLTAKPHDVASLGIARTFQAGEPLGSMLVVDNLLVGCHGLVRAGPLAHALGLPAARAERRRLEARAREVSEFLGLRPMETVLVSALPFAIRKRVDLGRALASSPVLLLLDEPAAGLAPQESREMGALLRRVRERFGCAILLVEHDMSLAHVCTQQG
jgi:ABC-type branched-subunit amino acid transport system ATPase component